MSYSTQKKNGKELNRLYEDDLPIHDWYRFVLSFPPHLVKDYIIKFGIQTDQIVLDPFAGTGTTLVECKKNGIKSYGCETNPIANFASTVKTNWSISGEELLAHATSIAEIAKKNIQQNKTPKPLNEDQTKLLIANSISDLPLKKALILLEAIDSRKSSFHNHERLAFAKQLVYSYSNLKFGPEVGVSRKKKEDVDVINLWLEDIKKMVKDLKLVETHSVVDSTSLNCDARFISHTLQPNSIDCVITSPPYPNEKDYTRTTRLENVILGYIHNAEELKETKKNLLRSNTKNVYKGDADDLWVKDIQSIQDLAAQIEAKRIELNKTSGFEKLYHKVLKLYFGGMARHLMDLKPYLKDGAKLAYVVGDQASYFRIPVRTAALLGEVAESIGYTVDGIDLFRERLSTTTKSFIREEVLLLSLKK
ncbi:DNA methyltransferase [uncultured Alistipes sp.]|uniref:DNA methyltransferase n=1 Tax=uncultured Alistipes sp. TaxID=538949 RepID=UPI0032204889